MEQVPSLPIPTVKVSVGAVVFRATGAGEPDVLLIRRGRPPLEGQWSIPGGKIEYGERLLDAVMREVWEETAVKIRVLDLLDVFESLPASTPSSEPVSTLSHHYVMVDYIAEWISGDPQAGDDAADAQFVPLSEAMDRMAWDTTRQAVARAAAYWQRRETVSNKNEDQ